MNNLNRARFKVSLEFGQLPSGKVMTATMFHDGCECPGYAVDIELPTKIKLVISGKDMTTDTILDDKGNIVQDLYVKITGISIDGVGLNSIFLHQGITLITDHGNTITSYFGHNGHVDFILDQPNVFQQIMSWQSVA
jgi:hypothetical protein